jgi:type I restriction-modification system DNA methylase subunit
MPLFQNTVVTKHLKSQDQEKTNAKWELFKSYFHNSEIQENIRNSKEEQFQEGFLRELFVKIFGYTLNPQPNFNLTTEHKNVKDSKKADGAILVNDEVKAVIELKGTNTTDLSKIEIQAFGYKNNQPKCTYVITSNFEKLRFYIDNAIEHIEFNLFTLTEKEFKLMYLCLAYENISKDLPSKIKKDSLSEEDVITKILYKDYSLFKKELYQNLVELNPQFDKLTLFKQSQTLLDRFLFLFFAEDRQLLPPNSVRLVLSQWKKLQDLDAYSPLFDRYKKYFGYLNTGFKGKNHNVFAYNGGLFKPNEVLDAVQIDDDLLYKHTLKLSEYDFNSEVDVNILGHIFENSLNEIDEVKAELEGKEVDKGNTKRKKDGVFYTPKYITKYIVENTVGKLCDEKKIELEIHEDDYSTDKKRQQKTIKGLLDKLTNYRDWLIQLTICDPACGSGAFLNQALDYLILEHGYIDELQAKLFGDAMILSDVEKSILENNLFGVDLNEESVEIAKLSLWLRTAVPNRKLNDLSNNIKCGNSLIDDPEVAGDKAFSWEKEFPHIFEKGGFDVVIGNPPYGAELSSKDWLKERYSKTSFGTIDSYKYFIQLGSEITKLEGSLSYIMPDSYLEKEYFKDVREHVSNSFVRIFNIKLGDDVFEEVNLPTAIIILQKKKEIKSDFYFVDLSNIENDIKKVKLFEYDNYLVESPEFSKSFVIFKSIIKTENTKPLIDLFNQVMGVKVYQKGKGKPKQTSYEIENDLFISNSQNVDFKFPFISQGIKRYFYEDQNEFINYGEWLAEPRLIDYFTNPKIIIREIINPTIYATYIEEDAVVKNIAAVITQKQESLPLKYLLPVLNSKLINHYVYEQSPKSSNKSYPSFNSKLLKNIPIIDCDIELKNSFIEKADQMLSLNKDLNDYSQKFHRTLQREFEEIDKLSKKLESWYELTYADFLKELKKKKVDLSLGQKAEWEDYFLAEQEKAMALKGQIDQTDKEIDAMVYALYGLSEEEIEIVEGG